MPVVQPQVQVSIGSRFENIELVQIAIESSLAQLSLGEQLSHRIGLAVREAVANAIKHGNQTDPDKQVHVECGVEDERVTVRVEDEGKGFDLDAIPDPMDPSNLMKTSGRGVFFMRQFMDEIDYTFKPEGGTIVTMSKSIEEQPSGATPTEED